jgi:hypothetical protein
MKFFWIVLALIGIGGCVAPRTSPNVTPSATASKVEPASVAFDCRSVPGLGENGFGIVAGDWNRDGHPDLAVTYATPATLAVFLNQGGREFSPGGTVEVGVVPRNIGVGDIDDDGVVDLVTANANSNDVTVLLGDGSGGFRRVAAMRSGVGPFDVDVADLDGDGHLDLVVANESNDPFSIRGTVSLFYRRGSGQGKGLFEKPVRLTAGHHPSAVEVADLDGKKGLDLVVANWESNDLSVFLSEGERKFAEAEQIAFGGGLLYSVVAADFDRDGMVDVAVTALEGRSVWVLHGDGKGLFPRRHQYGVGSGVRSVAAADVNADGALDLVTANVKDDTLSLLLQRGDGSFAPATTIPVGDGARTVIAQDLDADGKVDLAVINGRSADISVLWQTADGDRPCTPDEPPLAEALK